MALATLLKLNTRDTDIEEAGLDDPLKPNEKFDKSQLDNLVCTFWQTLHNQYPGAIPSGMIFLPGDKANRLGFGWAPRTWLSAYEMDYPDPLNFWNKHTDLSPEKGLCVYYPGFLLYPNSSSSRSKILGTSVASEPFSFPVDQTLKEWYSFQRAYDTASDQSNEITRLEKEETQLAIILSRSLPRESPKEIALLVEVTSKDIHETNDETSDPNGFEFRCSIIHRIFIWRRADTSSKDRDQFKIGGNGLDTCLGEVFSASQRWWVDSPVSTNQPTVQNSFTSGKEDNFQPPQLPRRNTFARVAGILAFWGGGKTVKR